MHLLAGEMASGDGSVLGENRAIGQMQERLDPIRSVTESQSKPSAVSSISTGY